MPASQLAPGRRSVVVFDLGNVLIRWDRDLLYAELIPDNKERQHFYTNIFTMGDNAVLDRGMPVEEMTAMVAARHPEYAALVNAFSTRWEQTVGPVINGTVAILGDLVAAGHRCIALSNWGADTFARVESRYEFLDWFEGLVISGREGVVKPEPAIFELLCSRHDVRPEEALFVDDSPTNVAAATTLGFDAHLFVDPPTLRSHLLARGLLS